MAAAIPTVYLSSTKEDLAEYRAAVLQQIASMTLHGVSMEVATADERPPWELCVDGVNSSDMSCWEGWCAETPPTRRTPFRS